MEVICFAWISIEVYIPNSFLLWSFVEILITVYVIQVFRLLRQFTWRARYGSLETAVLIHVGQLVLKACKCFMISGSRNGILKQQKGTNVFLA
jgi:hypothetical protein